MAAGIIVEDDGIGAEDGSVEDDAIDLPGFVAE
jgi:hypothetical protein